MTQAIQRHEPAGAIQQAPQQTISRNPVAVALAKLAEDPTPENVASMEKLTEMGIQYRKMDAEEWFNADFAEMQAEMPDIVCDKKGPWGGDYADKESIMRQIRPTLNKFGFSVKFNHPPAPNPQQLVTECVLSHKGGHSVTNNVTTRAGRPNKMMTEIQVDAGGYYAGERYALCAMLNIRADRVGPSEDAKCLGLPLTPEQIQELQDAAAAVPGDQVPILFKLAGVESWEEMRSGAIPVLKNFLKEKARAIAKKAAPSPSPSAPTQTPTQGAAAPQGPSEARPARVRDPHHEEAMAWAQTTPEVEIMAAVSADLKQMTAAKAAAKTNGPLDEMEPELLRTVGYHWKLARLVAAK